jgi:hypothetical protein
MAVNDDASGWAKEIDTMPGNARRNIVRLGEIGTYHCWSRCVQRAFLCGYDRATSTDYSYRRDWLEKLLAYLAGVFAVDVGNYSILSNHVHAILRTRPDIAAIWSEEELAWRWKMAWPEWNSGQWIREPTDREIETILATPGKVEKIREDLSSLSWFMARWKEPIARLCNAEMNTRGHFWESRFGSRELLDEQAKLTCSMYIDLNQLKAREASSLENSCYAAISRRIKAAKQREAAASQDEFARQENARFYAFPDHVVQSLYDDCWLAPISDQGPLITGEAQRQAALLNAVAQIESSLYIGQVPTDSSALGAPPETSTHADATPAPRDGHQAEVTIHSTSASSAPGDASPAQKATRPPPLNRRARASDAPILGVRWSEYRRVLEGLVALIFAGGTSLSETEMKGHILSELSGTLRQWGLIPEPWIGRLDKFADQCRCVVGTAEKVELRARQLQKRCFQGVTYCRAVFQSTKVNPDGFT